MLEMPGFHDQKSDEYFLEEIANKFGKNSPEYYRFLRAIELEKSKAKLKIDREQDKETKEMGGPLVKKIVATLENIESVELVSGGKRQEKILAEQKKQAKDLIRKLLRSAREHVDSIDKMTIAVRRAKDLEGDKQRQILEEADWSRKRKHNVLFDQAAITNRFILYHFGKLTEAQEDAFYEAEEKAGREVIDVKRIDLSQNTLWTESVTIGNRKSLAKWAFAINEELISLSQERLKELGLLES